MNKRIVIVFILLPILFLSFCGPGEGKEEKTEPIKEEVKKPEEAKEKTEKNQLGGCILTTPIGTVPEDLYQEGEVIKTDEYKPFTKKLTVCGITLIGRNDISDGFMKKVAKTIVGMFSQGESIDVVLQKEVITNMYKYRATIPLFKGEVNDEGDAFSAEERKLWEVTTSKNSVCDIIMEDIPGQVMEVVEHILHHVTDVGLHYTFPEEWGISKTSKLNTVMQEAIDKKYYDVTQYNDIPAGDIRHRVLLQEYAYWIIYGVWDFRIPFGPKNAEFSIMSKEELQTKLPQSYELVIQTIPKVMVQPDEAMLKKFFEKKEDN